MIEWGVDLPERVPPAKKLQIAVPSYMGHMWTECIAAMLSQRPPEGCEVTYTGRSRCAYPEDVRNALVTDFLLDSDCTDLLFWDDDVVPSMDAVARIAEQTRPIVGGVYPYKDDRLNFPLQFLQGQVRTDEEGLMEVPYLPTGFMRINRAVFHHMPYIAYNAMPDGAHTLGFFKNILLGEKRVGPQDFRLRSQGHCYRGEDVAFCEEWRNRGGKIYAMPNMEFGHIGIKHWRGNLHRWLLDGAGGKLNRFMEEAAE